MVGAIVNDNIVPLDYELHTGDIVNIKTNKNSKPSQEWLSIVKSSQTKNKIRAFFSKIDKKEAIEKGKDLLLKEIRRKKISINEFNETIPDILKDLKIESEDDLYYSIGTAKLSPNTVINISIKEEINKEEFILSKLSKREVKDIELKNDILVSGIKSITC